jgi:hypothetical protein
MGMTAGDISNNSALNGARQMFDPQRLGKPPEPFGDETSVAEN